MPNEDLYPPPLDRLKELGHLFTTWGQAEDEHDYVAELGLAAEHVPGLIRIARLWLDTYGDADRDEVGLWAPIHAWRALGQLGATEAVEPLLGMMDGLDDTDDDWHMEEFPKVMALIGPDAIGPLRRYMLGPSHGIYPRSVAGSSLVRIVERKPDCRAMAVSAIGDALAAYEQNDTSLNAFFVGYLLNLKAVEQAELIERAFAAGRVDVREELGVEGLGLAPARPGHPANRSFAPMRPSPPTSKSGFSSANVISTGSKPAKPKSSKTKGR